MHYLCLWWPCARTSRPKPLSTVFMTTFHEYIQCVSTRCINITAFYFLQKKICNLQNIFVQMVLFSSSAGRSAWFYLSMFESEFCEQRSITVDHGIKSVNETQKNQIVHKKQAKAYCRPACCGDIHNFLFSQKSKMAAKSCKNWNFLCWNIIPFFYPMGKQFWAKLLYLLRFLRY